MEPRIFLRGEPGCAPMMDYSNPALRELLDWDKPVKGLVELTKSEFRNAYPGERLPIFTQNPRGEACIWRVSAHLDLLPEGLQEEIKTFEEDYKKFIEIELDKQFRAGLDPSAEHLCKTYVSQVLKRELATWVKLVPHDVQQEQVQQQVQQPQQVQQDEQTIQKIAEQLVQTALKQLAPVALQSTCGAPVDSTLTPAEARVLLAIDAGCHSSDLIIQRLGVSKNRVYALLKRLKDKGVIVSGYTRKR